MAARQHPARPLGLMAMRAVILAERLITRPAVFVSSFFSDCHFAGDGRLIRTQPVAIRIPHKRQNFKAQNGNRGNDITEDAGSLPAKSARRRPGAARFSAALRTSVSEPVPPVTPRSSSRTPPDCAARFPTGLWRSTVCCLPSRRCRRCRGGSRGCLRRIL